MASIPCPNCGTQVRKPTNVLAIVLGIFGFLFVGGFMLIIVCLATITAVGANADTKFNQVDTELNEIDFETGVEIKVEEASQKPFNVN